MIRAAILVTLCSLMIPTSTVAQINPREFPCVQLPDGFAATMCAVQRLVSIDLGKRTISRAHQAFASWAYGPLLNAIGRSCPSNEPSIAEMRANPSRQRETSMRQPARIAETVEGMLTAPASATVGYDVKSIPSLLALEVIAERLSAPGTPFRRGRQTCYEVVTTVTWALMTGDTAALSPVERVRSNCDDFRTGDLAHRCNGIALAGQDLGRGTVPRSAILPYIEFLKTFNARCYMPPRQTVEWMQRWQRRARLEQRAEVPMLLAAKAVLQFLHDPSPDANCVGILQAGFGILAES